LIVSVLKYSFQIREADPENEFQISHGTPKKQNPLGENSAGSLTWFVGPGQTLAGCLGIRWRYGEHSTQIN
jgi:hypothetical protein